MKINQNEDLFYLMHSGAKIYPSRIKDTEIKLEDIAHHLASPKNQRFGGAMEYNTSYSVAQHSIVMAKYAMAAYGKDIARVCLMHDASEAYLGDMVSPLKKELKDYQKLEEELSLLIYDRYEIYTNKEIHSVVKNIDMSIMIDEVMILFPDHLEAFKEKYPSDIQPLGVSVETDWTPDLAKYLFLDTAMNLNIGD